MRRTSSILLACIVAAACASTAPAQPPPIPDGSISLPPPQNGPGPGRHHGGPRLSKDELAILKLTPEQHLRMVQIREEYHQKFEALRQTHPKDEQIQERRLRQELRTSILGVLTEEQQDAWSRLREKFHHHDRQQQ